jgi:hypothetical protein
VPAKDQSSRQVATALRQLAAGEQAVVAATEPRLDRDPGVEPRVRTLTAREREILGLLTIGRRMMALLGTGLRAGTAARPPGAPAAMSDVRGADRPIRQ